MTPLSLAWDGGRVLLATNTGSPTVRNALAPGEVNAALDSADDVWNGVAEIQGRTIMKRGTWGA